MVTEAEASANEYYNRGVALYDQTMYRESITAFENVLHSSQNSPPEHEQTSSYLCEAYTKLGLAHLRTKSLSVAEDCLTRAVGIRNGYADLHYHLGSVYYWQKRYAEAEDCFRKSLSINPKFARAQVHLGMAMLRQKKDEGLACMDDVESLGPQFDAEKHPRILQLYREGHKPEFFAIMDQIISYDGDRVKNCLERGHRLIKAHNYQEAGKVFLQAVKTCPEYADLRQYLGLCYLRQNSLGNAITHFSKALEINPRFSDARVSLSLAYEKLGRRDLAIHELQVVLETDPNNAVATRFLCVLQHRE